MTYIEKEKALSICQEYYLHCLEMHDFSGDSIADDIQTDIQNLPAADVVEVVRCKDCAIPHNKWLGCPKMNGLIPPPNHFCSYGERKDGE